MFRLASVRNEHFLEISLIEEAKSGYDSGDVMLLVAAESHGFTGRTEVWVLQEEIARFAKDLIDLSRNLKGSAVLRSVSPNELALEVRAVTSRGHLAVQGSLGYHIHEGERMYWHAAHVGFEFEPSQLEAAVGEPWVAKNAA
ncbi:WapI family immunity protein [Aquabacterium humicola]|uniref:WapI family immunity protein n=1 Tax=Aquabacterium humicola TaxID=3237377 RepID=UPI002543FB0F|nr:hypothetical protein [Rubrivivax pictus]